MIVVDTSALIAILKSEASGIDCVARLDTTERALISAATLTEALIVAAGHGLGREMRYLLDRYDFEIVELSQADAVRAAEAYERWGKGFHPARLNFGDCFAYALATEHECPLLYVGDDFAQTDVVPAL